MSNSGRMSELRKIHELQQMLMARILTNATSDDTLAKLIAQWSKLEELKLKIAGRKRSNRKADETIDEDLQQALDELNSIGK